MMLRAGFCADASAKFCGFDREGHCFITRETQQAILQLWRKIIANQQLALDEHEPRVSASAPDGTGNGAAEAAPALRSDPPAG